MTGLKDYNIPLIINGGDTFVSRVIEEGTARTLFDGVNQETVFTKINFDNHTYGAQDEEETEYFKDYLAEVKKSGLKVCCLNTGQIRHWRRRSTIIVQRTGSSGTMQRA